MTDDRDKRLAELRTRLEEDIEKCSGLTPQEMPDDAWDDIQRRDEWIREDRAQRKYVGMRRTRLIKLYDRCFPKPEWIVLEIERFYEDEEGALY